MTMKKTRRMRKRLIWRDKMKFWRDRWIWKENLPKLAKKKMKRVSRETRWKLK